MDQSLIKNVNPKRVLINSIPSFLIYCSCDKRQHSAIFICTHISIHLSSFAIISAKELTGFEGTIKCIFPVFIVKPNPPTRPCLAAMPLKLVSAKPCWCIRWIFHRTTKTVHSQSSVRGYALHNPLEVKKDFWITKLPMNQGWVKEDFPAFSTFPAFYRKSCMDWGRKNWTSDVCSVRKECTHYQQHFFHVS